MIKVDCHLIFRKYYDILNIFCPFLNHQQGTYKNSAPTPQAILPPATIHLEAWGQA